MRGDMRDKKTGDSPRVFSERMPFTGAFDPGRGCAGPSGL
jgi:hypothetical protein